MDKRDRMFNDVFLYSTFAFNGMCFVIGIIIDRFGSGIHGRSRMDRFNIRVKDVEMVRLFLEKTCCRTKHIGHDGDYRFYFNDFCF